MASDNSSLKSTSSKPKTPSEGVKRVGFARPTLIIPPPQMRSTPSPYTAYTAGTGPTPDVYRRKDSMFVFAMNKAKSGMGIGEKCSYWMYNKIKSWSKKWFTHCFLTIVLLIYTFGGAIIFITIEGQNEEKMIRTIDEEMDKLLLELRKDSINIPKKDSIMLWEGTAVKKLEKFEKYLLTAYDLHPLVVSNTGDKIWTMWNAVVYCTTVYTTIGYGRVYPTTITGRALTIVYAIIGIPLFLIALTDFGKLFTRGIKFVWSFVRRVYYTGSCRRARKETHVQSIFKGAQMMYDFATFRRPSLMIDPENPENPETVLPPRIPQSPIGPISSAPTETPTTPALSNYEINDEFNLPVTLALFILVSYMFIGAVIYSVWEKWDFDICFYFVFVSMSTIGFGDYMPDNFFCMMLSIFYLVFGLALMSMCINVVQEKLSDTFKEASAKIRATIGIQAEEDGSIVTPENVELAPVHDSLTVPVHDSLTVPVHDSLTVPVHDSLTVPVNDSLTVPVETNRGSELFAPSAEKES